MRLTRKIICKPYPAPLCMAGKVNFLGPLVGKRCMINPRLSRWLPFTILFFVFISTSAPAQETSPQQPQAIQQPAGEAPPLPPAEPAPSATPTPSHDLSPWGM